MKILTQGRTIIIDLPRELWAASDGNGGASVIGSGDRVLTFGNYDSMDRAMAVVMEIFDYYRRGKKSYIMPEK